MHTHIHTQKCNSRRIGNWSTSRIAHIITRILRLGATEPQVTPREGQRGSDYHLVEHGHTTAVHNRHSVTSPGHLDTGVSVANAEEEGSLTWHHGGVGGEGHNRI